MATTSISDVLRGLLPGSEWLEEIDPQSEYARMGKSAEGLYTCLVRITSRHPSPCLANLGQCLWDVMHRRLSRVAMYEVVPTVSFTIMAAKADGVQQSVVLLPPTWIEMFESDPLMQWGALIYTGSQAVDHFNGRFVCESPAHIENRAASYEAELLKRANSSKPNEYQLAVMKKFPYGFDAKYGYPYRDVVSNMA